MKCTEHRVEQLWRLRIVFKRKQLVAETGNQLAGFHQKVGKNLGFEGAIHDRSESELRKQIVDLFLGRGFTARYRCRLRRGHTQRAGQDRKSTRLNSSHYCAT